MLQPPRAVPVAVPPSVPCPLSMSRSLSSSACCATVTPTHTPTPTPTPTLTPSPYATPVREGRGLSMALPVREDRKNRVVIFDWDDTILPTSFLLTAMPHLSPEAQQQARLELQSVELLVMELLSICLHVYEGTHVYIVTNALRTWVEQSCQAYLPRLAHFLQNCLTSRHTPYKGRLQIVSASGRYASKVPQHRSLWKVCTFSDICDTLMLLPPDAQRKRAQQEEQAESFVQEEENEDTVEDEEGKDHVIGPQSPVDGVVKGNAFDFLEVLQEELGADVEHQWDLVSVGDADYEAHASLQVGHVLNGHPDRYCPTLVKVVHLKKGPTVSEMVAQLAALREQLPKILACRQHMFVDDIAAFT